MQKPEVNYRVLNSQFTQAADLAAYNALVASRPLAPPRRFVDGSRPVTAAELDAAKAAQRAPRVALRETREV